VIKLVALLCLTAAALAAAPTAEALTDREKFQKLAQRSGVSPSGNFDDALKAAKALCICQDASDDGRIGYLFMGVTSNQVVAICMVPTFNPSGGLGGASTCDVYSVVAK
jgi:Na+-translocating ferredoxin:NAD+ oxidoreductase RnfG subunit